jgi:hypothetical protein
MRRISPFIILLFILNLLVLLGQLWPAGAPPFAGAVNIIFLVLDLVFLALAWNERSTGRTAG